MSQWGSWVDPLGACVSPCAGARVWPRGYTRAPCATWRWALARRVESVLFSVGAWIWRSSARAAAARRRLSLASRVVLSQHGCAANARARVWRGRLGRRSQATWCVDDARQIGVFLYWRRWLLSLRVPLRLLWLMGCQCPMRPHTSCFLFVLRGGCPWPRAVRLLEASTTTHLLLPLVTRVL